MLRGTQAGTSAGVGRYCAAAATVGSACADVEYDQAAAAVANFARTDMGRDRATAAAAAAGFARTGVGRDRAVVGFARMGVGRDRATAAAAGPARTGVGRD